MTDTTDNLQWRVWSWPGGGNQGVTIKFSDGMYLESPSDPIDDGAELEEWDAEMQIDSVDDCERAGWFLDDDQYVSPNEGEEDPPTRWRPMSELPWWMMLRWQEHEIERLRKIVDDQHH